MTFSLYAKETVVTTEKTSKKRDCPPMKDSINSFRKSVKTTSVYVHVTKPLPATVNYERSRSGGQVMLPSVCDLAK